MPPTPRREGPTPAPLHFPRTKGHVGHRLSAEVIVAIIATVVLIAAGLTASIAFSGPETNPTPPPAPSGGHLAMAADAQPGTAARMFETLGPIVLAAKTVSQASGPLAAGSSVDLGGGISLTPAAGWTVEGTRQRAALLINGNSTAEFFVTVGKASGTDIAKELSNDIANYTKASASGLSNVQVTNQDQPNSVQSTHFQQELGAGYSGSLQTQQGTISVVGVFLELLNTSNAQSAFVDVHAVNKNALTTAAKDGDTMVNSML
jgi:hypothetical protein